MKQEFVDCRAGGPMVAVFTVSYGATVGDVHRAVDYLSTAREMAEALGLPGFWRVKEVAK